MHRIERKSSLPPEDIEAVSELLAAAKAADDHAPLDEHAWLDLVQGGRAGFAGLVAWDEDSDEPVGYAQVTRGAGSWGIEYVVDPGHRLPGSTVGEDLVRDAAGVIASQGGGHVHLWVNRPGPASDRAAGAAGLTPGRVLYQMRRPLPVEAALADPEPLPTRAFVPGQDEDAWLEVNNRAFHWHPEQGGWDRETIAEREAAPWFDPAGFLLYEPSGRLLGFCWTKVHSDHRPVLGEIYVIAVDPDAGGHGLGRRLVLAGLDHLTAAGISVGMLYCDATNAPALKLYIDLGFTVNHIDQAYVGNISAAPVP